METEEQFEVSLEEFKTVLEEYDLLGCAWNFHFGHNHKVFYLFVRDDVEYSLSFSCDFFFHFEFTSKILEKQGLRSLELAIDDMDKGTSRVYKLKA